MKIPQYLKRNLEYWLDPCEVPGLEPPGCNTTFLETPYYNDYYGYGPNKRRGCIELGIFHRHRFAFYYWVKWKREYCLDVKIKPETFDPPDLVTMDWHNDFGADNDFLEEDIRSLDQKNLTEVALFTWVYLPKLDDGHIFPAVKLNLLGNVYLITKDIRHTRKTRVIQDIYGNPHHIHYVSGLKMFANRYTKGRMNSIYWDIDLDYFTCGKNRDDRRIKSASQIEKLFQDNDETVRIILSKLRGITIALEPEYSGGLLSALNLYKIWESIFFTGSVTKPFSEYTWRKKYLID